MQYDKQRLIEIIKNKGLKFGDFTLASGKKASYYLDCRKVTLDSEGAMQVGLGMLEMLGDPLPNAIGGMAIGADPITAATITLVALQGKSLSGFIVRKEVKEHGTGQEVEGPVEPGQSCFIVEDVVTTGGSALAAIEKAKEAGLEVLGVVAIIDRMEGGRAAFANAGYRLRTLLTIEDLGIEPPQ